MIQPTNHCTNTYTTEETRKGCEKLIINSLNDFNTTFKNYKSAYHTYSNESTPTNHTATNLNTEYQNMINKFKEIEVFVEKYSSKFLTKTETTQTSQNVYDKIITDYNQMIESRKKLDQQLYDLYTNEYDSVYSNKPFVDSTVVTGILWTLLVTFILYYVIVKM